MTHVEIEVLPVLEYRIYRLVVLFFIHFLKNYSDAMTRLASYLQNVQSPSHVSTGKSHECFHPIFTYIDSERKQAEGIERPLRAQALTKGTRWPGMSKVLEKQKQREGWS